MSCRSLHVRLAKFPSGWFFVAAMHMDCVCLGIPIIYLIVGGLSSCLLPLSPQEKKKIIVFWRAVSLQIELDDLLFIHGLFQI